jgi:hypothetical protein
MNQALYAHMNNKRKMKKKKNLFSPSVIQESSAPPLWKTQRSKHYLEAQSSPHQMPGPWLELPSL